MKKMLLKGDTFNGKLREIIYAKLLLSTKVCK